MRRLLLAVLLTGLAAALTASPAAAAPTYGGTTSTRDAIVVTARPDAQGVRQLVVGFHVVCEDGERHIAFHEVVPVVRGTIRPPYGRLFAEGNNRGRLVGVIAHASTIKQRSRALLARVEATVTPTAVTGTIRAELVEVDRPGIVPGAAIPEGARVLDRCASGRLRFTAKRDPGRIYGGVTSQDEPVVLRFDEGRRVLRSVGFGWHASCTEGGYVDYPDGHTDIAVRGGAFSHAFGWSPANTGMRMAYQLSGRVGERRASGRLRVDVTTVDDRCSTGALRWRAVTG